MWKYNPYVPKYLPWFMTPEPSAPAQPAPLFLGHGEREHPGRRVRRSRAVPKTSRKQIEWPASPKEASPCMVLWPPHSLFIFWIPQWMKPMIWSEPSSFNHFLKAQPLNMKDPLFQHGNLLVGPLHIQAITLGHEIFMEEHQEQKTSHCPPIARSFASHSPKSHLFGMPWEPSTKKNLFCFQSKESLCIKETTYETKWFNT